MLDICCIWFVANKVNFGLFHKCWICKDLQLVIANDEKKLSSLQNGIGLTFLIQLCSFLNALCLCCYTNLVSLFFLSLTFGQIKVLFLFLVQIPSKTFLYFLFSFSCIQVLFHYDPCSLMLKLILTTKKAFGKNFCLSHEHERAF